MSIKSHAACLAAVVALLVAAPADARKKDKEADEPSSREVTGKNGVEGEIVGTEIPGSPFTKLEIGMSQKQVRDLIGKQRQEDAECGEYITGKAFIPFNFGSDRTRVECAYKGLGRLVFTGSLAMDGKTSLIRIEYDGSEDGYR